MYEIKFVSNLFCKILSSGSRLARPNWAGKLPRPGSDLTLDEPLENFPEHFPSVLLLQHFVHLWIYLIRWPRCLRRARQRVLIEKRQRMFLKCRTKNQRSRYYPEKHHMSISSKNKTNEKAFKFLLSGGRGWGWECTNYFSAPLELVFILKHYI